MDYESFHQTILAGDIAGFGSSTRTDVGRADMRERLDTMLRDCLEASRVPLERCTIEDRGDGFFVLVEPNVAKARLVNDFLLRFATALRRHNMSANASAQMHLRLALHAGEVARDPRGAVGTDVNRAFRLLDSEPLRRALQTSDADLAVIVSDLMYDSVVRQSAGPILAEEYKRVVVDVKEFQGNAWVTVFPRRSSGDVSSADSPPPSDKPQPGQPRSITIKGRSRVGGVIQGDGATIHNIHNEGPSAPWPRAHRARP